jgi:hypothetical protein
MANPQHSSNHLQMRESAASLGSRSQSPQKGARGTAASPEQRDDFEFVNSVPSPVVGMAPPVTDLQGPPSERTHTEKLQDLKKLARQYARDRGSCDDMQISYLEILEDRDDDNLRLAQMLAG